MISLKAARVNAGYTQETAAREIGVTSTSISQWEKGGFLPRIDVAIRLAKLYGMKLDDIDFTRGLKND